MADLQKSSEILAMLPKASTQPDAFIEQLKQEREGMSQTSTVLPTWYSGIIPRAQLETLSHVLKRTKVVRTMRSTHPTLAISGSTLQSVVVHLCLLEGFRDYVVESTKSKVAGHDQGGTMATGDLSTVAT